MIDWWTKTLELHVAGIQSHLVHENWKLESVGTIYNGNFLHAWICPHAQYKFMNIHENVHTLYKLLFDVLPH